VFAHRTGLAVKALLVMASALALLVSPESPANSATGLPNRNFWIRDDLLTTGILAISGVVIMSFGFLDAKRKRVPHAER
jgi:predicted cobalt transporter CbtA